MLGRGECIAKLLYTAYLLAGDALIFIVTISPRINNQDKSVEGWRAVLFCDLTFEEVFPPHDIMEEVLCNRRKTAAARQKLWEFDEGTHLS